MSYILYILLYSILSLKHLRTAIVLPYISFYGSILQYCLLLSSGKPHLLVQSGDSRRESRGQGARDGSGQHARCEQQASPSPPLAAQVVAAHCCTPLRDDARSSEHAVALVSSVRVVAEVSRLDHHLALLASSWHMRAALLREAAPSRLAVVAASTPAVEAESGGRLQASQAVRQPTSLATSWLPREASASLAGRCPSDHAWPRLSTACRRHNLT